MRKLHQYDIFKYGHRLRQQRNGERVGQRFGQRFGKRNGNGDWVRERIR
jgi:hypothetical protein